MSDNRVAPGHELMKKVRRSKGLGYRQVVRNFGRRAVDLEQVVYLSADEVQDLLGITVTDLTGDDVTICRALLAAARRSGLDALVSPAAVPVVGARTIVVLPHAQSRVWVVHAELCVPPLV